MQSHHPEYQHGIRLRPVFMAASHWGQDALWRLFGVQDLIPACAPDMKQFAAFQGRGVSITFSVRGGAALGADTHALIILISGACGMAAAARRPLAAGQPVTLRPLAAPARSEHAGCCAEAALHGIIPAVLKRRPLGGWCVLCRRGKGEGLAKHMHTPSQRAGRRPGRWVRACGGTAPPAGPAPPLPSSSSFIGFLFLKLVHFHAGPVHAGVLCRSCWQAQCSRGDAAVCSYPASSWRPSATELQRAPAVVQPHPQGVQTSSGACVQLIHEAKRF